MLRVAWMTPYGEADMWNPALRLRRRNVQENLQSRGLADTLFLMDYYDLADSVIASKLADFDVVVMTEQSERDYQITKRVRELSRAAIVRDHCEYVFGWPWQMECYAETDVVACSSPLITRESIARGIKAQYIPDMYEVVNPVVPRDTSSGLTAVFMGSGESLNMVTSPWASFIADAGYTLKVITDVDGRGEKWVADTWREFYRQGDVAIVPQSVQAYPGKSSVKVAQALAAGLPVLCSPLESYSEVVVNGVNGFVLPNDMGAAWKDALITLRDPVVRAAVAQGALLSSAAFSPDAISDRWLQVFNSALAIARERDGI